MFTIMNQKLNKTNRMLILVVAFLMFLVYFLPIWFVNLSAPQYPETLGMYIYINDVRGRTPHDLQNINLLNHYRGILLIIVLGILFWIWYNEYKHKES